ncbi:uncharacterized protein LOC126687883 [Mercurialis annua]|uniref:uncharacterized protein LOC126687883 n=1 Tax=Mercurialis annua TaxID=3986 RepID=UPI00215F38ED|nr:uncharacterized protein LOC126687883 [Mercurialis annua]
MGTLIIQLNAKNTLLSNFVLLLFYTQHNCGELSLKFEGNLKSQIEILSMLTDKQRKSLKIIATLLIYKKIKRRHIGRRPDTNSSLSGSGYVQEILDGNPAHSLEMLRMKKEAFLALCQHFKAKGWLKNSRYISVEEKMAIFMFTLSQNHRNRAIKRRFNHSTQTVHNYFHEVLLAMLHFAKEMVIPTTFDPDLNQVTYHRRLRNVFKGAVGALDGTLVRASIPPTQQTPYRGRGRGDCYQNVLAICDFDMIFTFVWAGWEGVAHDSRVLTETMRDPSNNFPFTPHDKYYLCDAAYPNTRGFMAPYRNTRYWLSDFRNDRARTKEEIFNHAHARLRNVIERSFGVLKARFPILKTMPSYSFAVQRNIVIACVSVHNYLRKMNITDDFFEQFDREEVIFQGANNNVMQEGTQRRIDQMFMANLRDQIANELINRRV